MRIETVNGVPGFYVGDQFCPLMMGGAEGADGGGAEGAAGAAPSGDVGALGEAFGGEDADPGETPDWEDYAADEEDEDEQPDEEEEKTEADNFFERFRQSQPRPGQNPAEEQAAKIHYAVNAKLEEWAQGFARAQAAVEAQLPYLPEDQAMALALQLEDARLKVVDTGLKLRERAREAAMEPIVRSQAIGQLTDIVMKSVPKGSISKAEVQAALEDTTDAGATLALARQLTKMARRGANVQRAQKGTDKMGGSGPAMNNRPNLKTFDVLSALDKAYTRSERDLARQKRK